jgi:hypothetical protein
MKDIFNKFKYVVSGSIRYVWKLKVILTRALLIPFGFYIALDLYDEDNSNSVVSIIIFVISLSVHTLFAITTHRIILLGPDSVSKWGIQKWTKRETMFALHVLGLGLIVMPIYVLSFVPVIGWLIAFSLIFWFVGRFSLVFPAIAIDQGFSYKHSWQLTKKHQLLMMLIVIFFPLALTLPAIIIGAIPYTFLLTSILSTLSTVFTVAALSVTYKEICIEMYES